MSATEFSAREEDGVLRLTLHSADGLNRLTLAKVVALRQAIVNVSRSRSHLPLIISGEPNFSTGADLNEIVLLSGTGALQFSMAGQALMNAVAEHPAPVCAAITGYCMGGGLDLALACRYRIASSHAILGHRGAALGLITGWGGTQRLPRIVGKARALQMFIAAEKLHASEALRIGLLDEVAADPRARAREHCLLVAGGTQVQLRQPW